MHRLTAPAAALLTALAAAAALLALRALVHVGSAIIAADRNTRRQ